MPFLEVMIREITLGSRLVTTDLIQAKGLFHHDFLKEISSKETAIAPFGIAPEKAHLTFNADPTSFYTGWPGYFAWFGLYNSSAGCSLVAVTRACLLHDSVVFDNV